MFNLRVVTIRPLVHVRGILFHLCRGDADSPFGGSQFGRSGDWIAALDWTFDQPFEIAQIFLELAAQLHRLKL